MSPASELKAFLQRVTASSLCCAFVFRGGSKMCILKTMVEGVSYQYEHSKVGGFYSNVTVRRCVLSPQHQGHHETVKQSSTRCQTQSLQHRETLLDPQCVVMCTRLVKYTTLVARNSSVLTLLTPRCGDTHEISDTLKAEDVPSRFLISRKSAKTMAKTLEVSDFEENESVCYDAKRGIRFRVSRQHAALARGRRCRVFA